MGNTDSAYDAVIIGAGFGGLSAGALLAQQGRRVLVLEKTPRLGGRAAYHEEDGFIWQYGQHSHRLARDGIAAQVFERLGMPLDFIDTRGHAAYLYVDGQLYPRPEGALDFLRSPILPLRSRLTFIRFYAKLLRADPAEWYDCSFREFYQQWFHDPYVERFLSFLSFTVMIPDPSLASAGEVIAFIQRAKPASIKQGEPRGGSKQVIDRLSKYIEEHGGIIRMDEPVRSVVIREGRAVGVSTSQGEYAAQHVIFAAPLFHLFDVVPANKFPEAFVQYVEGMRSSRGLSIDFVSDEPLSDIKGGILGIEVPLWVKFQSNIDPTVAPRGKHVCTWAMLFDPHAPVTPEAAERTERRIKAIMEEVAPGCLSKVKRERKLVIPVINANMLIPAQSYPHRPEIVCREVEGLYLAGDTAQGDGCSGDIAFSSAMKLADGLSAQRA